MKRKSLKSLSLNKKYVSSFETNQVSGGAYLASGAETCGGQTSSYPPTVSCPTRFA
ncbi:hypothetical protein ACJD0Z_09390 [Flavobacteriaceae bacterium M23B6Z8]